MYRSTVLTCSLGLFLATMTPAHAYLDPGTGSMILQAIIGAVAIAFTTISVYWYKFKSFFLERFRPKDKDASH